MTTFRTAATQTTAAGFVRCPKRPMQMSETREEASSQEALFKVRNEELKREEAECIAERDRLEQEKNFYVRETNRIRHEERTAYANYGLLNGRYLPLSLLGKGGFSEVWKARDLQQNCFVACKIHHVDKQWDDHRKKKYVERAIRENDIQKSLDHPHIVQLFDRFKINDDSFCSVLEYCNGDDLEQYLKKHKQMPEKDAPRVIKQASVAKREEQLAAAPETFVYGVTPTISSKVDVWSLGIILFECLYGKKPFGNDRTQPQIWQERTILGAKSVDFPNADDAPKVSAEAKASFTTLHSSLFVLLQEFIRTCLVYNKDERCDVIALAKHKYLQQKD
ncbi:BMA-TLK-1, isoform e [Aphelenchoides fujianensis]|nr:BMA-TLK-1, isoform e [Aphelenchoides fujianensis]